VSVIFKEKDFFLSSCRTGSSRNNPCTGPCKNCAVRVALYLN